MNTKRDDKLALDTVRAIIQEWDLYELLKTGAPSDEFDDEIALIASAASIPRIRVGDLSNLYPAGLIKTIYPKIKL